MSFVQVPLQVPLQMQMQMQAPVQLQVATSASSSSTASSLKEVNDVPLTRKVLTRVLCDLSERLYRSFRRQVRLVVHGGAVMVLHPHMKHRESTQDVDYIHRSFVSEYRALGFADAEQRLRTCIAETALTFGLGADWMNDHADVALPWAQDQHGRTYDPIFHASTQPQNALAQTIFNERGLALVAVPWPWAVALKLVRYLKQDPTDCAAVLRLGSAQRRIRWTVDALEKWLADRCWPMNYAAYDQAQKLQLRQRLQDALGRAFPPESLSLSMSLSMPHSHSHSQLRSHSLPVVSRAPSETAMLYFS